MEISEEKKFIKYYFSVEKYLLQLKRQVALQKLVLKEVMNIIYTTGI